MTVNMPTETEVRSTYEEGVESVVTLFNRIGIELLGLAGELSTQAQAIEALKMSTFFKLFMLPSTITLSFLKFELLT